MERCYYKCYCIPAAVDTIGAVGRGGCVPQILFGSPRAAHAGHGNPNCSKVKFSRHRLQSACRGILIGRR